MALRERSKIWLALLRIASAPVYLCALIVFRHLRLVLVAWAELAEGHHPCRVDGKNSRAESVNWFSEHGCIKDRRCIDFIPPHESANRSGNWGISAIVADRLATGFYIPCPISTTSNVSFVNIDCGSSAHAKAH